jgi:hypothetical protein
VKKTPEQVDRERDRAHTGLGDESSELIHIVRGVGFLLGEEAHVRIGTNE